MAFRRAAPLLAGTRRRTALPATFAAAALAAFAPSRASACGWDGESYHAEAKSLPCVYSALTSIYPKHTPEYHERRAAAAVALSWAPDYGPALDDEGLALMKLGRLAEARAVMERRLRGEPDAYASHQGMDRGFSGAQSVANSMDYNYGNWERQQIKRGLPVWREEGLSVVYAKQHQLRKRCATPGIIDERPADPRLDDAAAKRPAWARLLPRRTT